MSIGPISSVGSSATPPIPRPESTEAPGAADHDNDSDNTPGPAAATGTTSAPKVPGQLDVKA
jgi:hypothetical protein